MALTSLYGKKRTVCGRKPIHFNKLDQHSREWWSDFNEGREINCIRNIIFGGDSTGLPRWWREAAMMERGRYDLVYWLFDHVIYLGNKGMFGWNICQNNRFKWNFVSQWYIWPEGWVLMPSVSKPDVYL